jgi:hypothetical protein
MTSDGSSTLKMREPDGLNGVLTTYCYCGGHRANTIDNFWLWRKNSESYLSKQKVRMHEVTVSGNPSVTCCMTLCWYYWWYIVKRYKRGVVSGVTIFLPCARKSCQVVSHLLRDIVHTQIISLLFFWNEDGRQLSTEIITCAHYDTGVTTRPEVTSPLLHPVQRHADVL